MNLKTILPTDQQFNHNGIPLVYSVRRNAFEEDILDIIVGNKTDDTQFDAKIVRGLFLSDLNGSINELKTLTANIINPLIAQTYGPFQGEPTNPIDALVAQIQQFVVENFRYNPAVGVEL